MFLRTILVLSLAAFALAAQSPPGYKPYRDPKTLPGGGGQPRSNVRPAQTNTNFYLQSDGGHSGFVDSGPAN